MEVTYRGPFDAVVVDQRTAVNGDPFEVDDDLGAQLVAQGWEPAQPLGSHTKDELVAIAATRGVDVSDCKTKGDLIAALEAAPAATED